MLRNYKGEAGQIQNKLQAVGIEKDPDHHPKTVPKSSQHPWFPAGQMDRHEVRAGLGID